MPRGPKPARPASADLPANQYWTNQINQATTIDELNKIKTGSIMHNAVLSKDEQNFLSNLIDKRISDLSSAN